MEGLRQEPPKSFWSAFTSKRVWLMMGLGFSCGLPNPLTGSTLAAWMADVEVDLTLIGIFALVHLPYNLKPFWAPLLDRYSLPFLGRRKGWMMASQLTVMVAIFLFGTLDPKAAPAALAAGALVLTFFSASQDIVTDAFRTDTLAPHERASGTAVFVAAYRVAMIVAGAVALIMADHLSWRVVYAFMAAFMLIGMIATWLSTEPERTQEAPTNVLRAYYEPLKEFFSRRGAWLLLTVLLSYKVGDAIAGHLRTPFLLELGFTKTEIGVVAKGVGLAASIFGSFLGGGLIARFGMLRCLIAFGILQALANLLYIVLAVVGKDDTWLTIAIMVDELFNGLGTSAFVCFLMSLCHAKFTATQYACFSALASVSGRLISASGGALADFAGWPIFFLVTVVAAIPAVVALFFVPDPDTAQSGDCEGGGGDGGAPEPKSPETTSSEVVSK